MSDFLSHLAAKNLNLAPILQPRPLSLFEPAALRLAHERLDISASVEADMPRALTLAQQPAVAATPTPIDPLARADESSARPAPLTLPVRIEPPPIAPQPPEQQREVRREIVNITNIRSVVEPSIVHPPISERVVLEKESVAPDRAAVPIEIELAAKPTSNEEPAKDAPHPIVTPVIERIIHERERAAPSQAQRSDQVAHPASPQIAAQPTATEPPTIHVTIGRIEVRATPPAASTKRSTQASSTLSLDDYLRAREGGKR